VEVDFLVNTRAHPLDKVFGRFCALGPLYVLGQGSPAAGSSTAVPVVVTLISTVWGFFIHANLRWRFGPLECLISTPAFHHWHHTKTGPINRNYASTLPWLDRIFGTYYLPKEWPDCYGIDSDMPHSLIGQLAYPLNPNPPAVSPQELAATAHGNSIAEEAYSHSHCARQAIKRQLYKLPVNQGLQQPNDQCDGPEPQQHKAHDGRSEQQ
jgi:Fatty acid hydroxylase superfamily